MINIKDKKDCCGCSSCASICPKKCITMKEDSEGFLYPEVNEDLCINCGLCEKHCPIINKKEQSDKIKCCYVGYAKDKDIRMNSSSGGIFSVLAQEIIKGDGIVVGAAFNDKFEVHHIIIDSIDDLYKLRGSKYVQSDIEDIYIRIKEVLNQDKKVLFTGVACQVSGLKSYLGKEYDNLITLDVLCHGTPTQKLFKRYIEEKERKYNSSIKDFYFRKKNEGWKLFNIRCVFENSEIYDKNFKEDEYMRLFLSNICLRPSCYDCRFKNLDRSSDITLGDCWGIENYMPYMDDDKGTSVIIIHSNKGQALIDEIKNDLNIVIADIDKALPPNSDSRKSVKPHIKRSIFFKKLNNNKSIYNLVRLLDTSKIKKIIRIIKSKISKNIKRFRVTLDS